MGAQSKCAKKEKKAAPKKRVRDESSKSLIEKLESADNFQTPDSKRRKRTDNSAFTKMVKDNFYSYGFTEDEVDAACVDGQWLLQQLRDDRERWRTGEIAMGKNYFAEMRIKYRSPHSSFSLLKAANVDDPIDEVLENALELMFSNNREVQAFQDWAAQVESMNQIDVVGLFKGGLMVPPTRSMENANIVCTILQVVKRLDIHTKHAYEWKLFFNHGDLALQKHHAVGRM